MSDETEKLRGIWAKNKYYAMAEDYMKQQWEQIIWPIIRGCDFRHVVDLAAGEGRNSEYLAKVAYKLTIVDLCEENINKCQKRFNNHSGIYYQVCDGQSIPVAAGSVSLLYCWDAMVHFEPEIVRLYLLEAQRVLEPKGKAFLHHSNYTGFCNTDWRHNPHARNYMSKSLFSYWARKYGFRIISSELYNWGDHKNLDCVTLLEKCKCEG